MLCTSKCIWDIFALNSSVSWLIIIVKLPILSLACMIFSNESKSSLIIFALKISLQKEINIYGFFKVK